MYISENLRNNENIIKLSINNDYKCFDKIPDEFKKDSNFLLKLIKINYLVYKLINVKYKNTIFI